MRKVIYKILFIFIFSIIMFLVFSNKIYSAGVDGNSLVTQCRDELGEGDSKLYVFDQDGNILVEKKVINDYYGYMSSKIGTKAGDADYEKAMERGRSVYVFFYTKDKGQENLSMKHWESNVWKDSSGNFHDDGINDFAVLNKNVQYDKAKEFAILLEVKFFTATDHESLGMSLSGYKGIPTNGNGDGGQVSVTFRVIDYLLFSLKDGLDSKYTISLEGGENYEERLNRYVETLGGLEFQEQREFGGCKRKIYTRKMSNDDGQFLEIYKFYYDETESFYSDMIYWGVEKINIAGKSESEISSILNNRKIAIKTSEDDIYKQWLASLGIERLPVEFKDVLTDINSYIPTTGTVAGEDEIESKVSIVLTIITNIGIILAVLMSAIMGVKYMLGSLEEKAEYKKDIIPYLIGACLLFGICTIVKILQSIGTTINTI